VSVCLAVLSENVAMYDMPLGYLPMQYPSIACLVNVVWFCEFRQYFSVCIMVGQSVAILARLDLRKSVASACAVNSGNVSVLVWKFGSVCFR